MYVWEIEGRGKGVGVCVGKRGVEKGVGVCVGDRGEREGKGVGVCVGDRGERDGGRCMCGR